MENIAPPMPAKQALAALDQPAPTDIGSPKRISKKVRAAIDARVVSGEQVRPGLRELYICAGVTEHQPAARHREIEPGAVFGWAALECE